MINDDNIFRIKSDMNVFNTTSNKQCKCYFERARTKIDIFVETLLDSLQNSK